MKHVELMTARDIIPVKVVELVVTSMEVVNRATADRYSIERYTKVYFMYKTQNLTKEHLISGWLRQIITIIGIIFIFLFLYSSASDIPELNPSGLLPYVMPSM